MASVTQQPLQSWIPKLKESSLLSLPIKASLPWNQYSLLAASPTEPNHHLQKPPWLPVRVGSETTRALVSLAQGNCSKALQLGSYYYPFRGKLGQGGF